VRELLRETVPWAADCCALACKQHIQRCAGATAAAGLVLHRARAAAAGKEEVRGHTRPRRCAWSCAGSRSIAAHNWSRGGMSDPCSRIEHTLHSASTHSKRSPLSSATDRRTLVADSHVAHVSESWSMQRLKLRGSQPLGEFYAVRCLPESIDRVFRLPDSRMLE